MSPSPSPAPDVSASDVEFLRDLLELQHHAVRMCRLAETRSPRRAVRAFAHAASRAQRSEITAVSSCLRDWAPVTPGPVEVTDSSVLSWMAPTEDTDALSHVGRADFDVCFLERMGTHHRAAIARSHVELVQGLSPRSRSFATHAVTQHCAGLTELDRLSC